MSESLRFELLAIDRATAPLKAVQAQVARTTSSVNAATSTMRGFAQGSLLANTATQRWAKGALQQAGYQVGDFAVQLANGTNGLQAFGQQAPQLLQIFGPIGAVVGAAVAIIAAFGVVAQKTGKDLSELGSALGVLQEPLMAVVDSIKYIGSSLGPVFGDLSGEIDTAIIAVGLYASVLAIKAIPAMIAASGAAGMFTAALATFRAAILASAISAGSFTTFITLSRAALLTLGAAVQAVGAILMRLLPVAVIIGLAKLIEIFMRLKEGAGGFGNAIGLLADLAVGVWQKIKAGATWLLASLELVFSDIELAWINMTGKLYEVWGRFLDAIAETKVGQSLGFVGGNEEKALNEWAANIRKNTDELILIMDTISDAEAVMSAPTAGWKELQDAIAAGTEEVNIFGDAAAEASDGAKAKLAELQNRMKEIGDTVSSSMTEAFMSMVDGTKSVKDAFRDMAREIIKKLYEVLVVQRLVGSWDEKTGTGTGLTGFLMGMFRGIPGLAGARAMGGPITGGKPYLVGERGPEIIVPSRNANVVANGQGGGSSVNVTQNISFGAGVSRAEIQAMLPKIVESTKAAVFDAQRRSVRGMGYA